MNEKQNKRMQGLSTLIGNTPLLAIEFKYKGSIRKIYAKAEFLNLTGSIKDRMAYHILNKAYENGNLKEGDRIIEATSGNTGIAFSGVGRAMGHPVTIFMPNWMSQERKNLIKSFGANIRLVTPEEGGFLGSIEMANQLAADGDATFLPRQFSNYDNCEAHYTTTGPELYWQLKFRNLQPDAFVAGVGTGGTVMGVGKYLQEQVPGIKIHPLEPSNSPTMTTGYKVGKHRIQGISDEFIPSIVKLGELDDIISVDDGDSIIMAQKLSAELGLGVGISSGANFLGALKIQEELGPDAVVVTIFADDNKKYLSTDLMNEEPVKDDFLSMGVELSSYAAYKRVCHTCCDPKDCMEACYEDDNKEVKLPACPRREPVMK
ncbi:PLP-dependent cysteine synthase family protein [Carboxylicivirga sp. M1479]|uniref:PLP-dependent cysteine synthase family protein n=1 Tax=Carboxylicivirga sp. M1479 TaxID=2594476 RepID=UPI0011778FB5|nr:PLP-dependent cysteine synthase family protein [Carboxylicivirga sp. M1479]TRX66025.1 PLP-dependent cysteine synthase family protein [Carboxylicivirga sp. M1479]